MPFFSIIITALNAEEHIEQTVNSVLAQTDNDYEIIIKDGGSTDGTLVCIPEDEKIKVFCIKDSGIYEGMNQGIERASGRYLYFLNCGDTLYNEHVLKHVHEFAQEQKADDAAVIYGNYYTKGLLATQPQKMSKSFLFRRPMCHQTMFFGRRIFEEHGLYDTRYRILADYDLTLKAFMGGSSFIHSGVPVCTYLEGGFSAQEAQRQKLRTEYQAIRELHSTRWDKVKRTLYKILTLESLRIYLASEQSPKIIQKMYRAVANQLNK